MYLPYFNKENKMFFLAQPKLSSPSYLCDPPSMEGGDAPHAPHKKMYPNYPPLLVNNFHPK